MPLSTLSPWPLLPLSLQSSKDGFNRVYGGMKRKVGFWWANPRRKMAPPAHHSGLGPEAASGCARRRKVVEHIYLIKARDDISNYEEKDMLDYLYTFQYHMNGIIAISLGRLSDPNADGFTHAAFMRFQKKDDLAKFYQKSALGVLKEHVMPYCHGLISVDFESEVEDDILPIFRRGEEFNYGVEFVLLISVTEDALGRPVEDAMANLASLTRKFEPLIVQATQGSNINPDSKDYTHGAVVRFSSFEALEAFTGSMEYKNMWSSKFEPIAGKSLAVSFSVDPVGTDIM